MANIAQGKAECYISIEAKCWVLYFMYSTWQGNDLSVITNFLNIHSPPLNIPNSFGSSLGSTLLQRLQRIQNCAARLCSDLQKYDHVSAFYHRLSWLPLPCFIQFRLLYLMYQQYHHFKCIPLEPPMPMPNHLHKLNTCSDNMIGIKP